MHPGHTISGAYTARAKAGSGLPDRRVHWDMEEDGGGWMLLLSYNFRVSSIVYLGVCPCKLSSGDEDSSPHVLETRLDYPCDFVYYPQPIYHISHKEFESQFVLNRHT